MNEIVERKADDLKEVKNYESGYLDICSKNLTSLEGCPEKVDGSFDCCSNNLTSFEHFPKYIGGHCGIDDNQFISLNDIDQHIEYIGGIINIDGNNITSGYSDLFGINGLRGIAHRNFNFTISKHHKAIEEIVNKYIKKKDIINFQDEMIKAGYESYL